MKKLHNLQGKLIQKINQFLSQRTLLITNFQDLIFYLCPFGETKGNTKLFFFNKLKFFKYYFKTTFSDFYSLLGWQS